MPEVALWEACALSLNIDPASLQNDPYASLVGHGGGRIFLPGSFPDDATKDTYYQRLRLLRAWRSNSLFTPCAGDIGLPDDNSKVKLIEFVGWAQGMDLLGIPNELAWLVPANPPQVSVPPVAQNTIANNDKPGTRRANLLTAVIDKAMEAATDPNDANSVWASLVEIAQAKDRPSPLLGFVDGEGVKYQGLNDVEFFILKNLRDRMRRARKNSPERC
jgi:hypothetical protein